MRYLLCLAVLVLTSFLAPVHAAVLWGPTPYLSAADIPAGFYAAGPAALEDMEDGLLDDLPGVTANAGAVYPALPNLPPFQGLTDSVDADDGIIALNPSICTPKAHRLVRRSAPRTRWAGRSPATSVAACDCRPRR